MRIQTQTLMNSLRRHHRLQTFSSSSSSSYSCCQSLTEVELAKINLLLPRLCLSSSSDNLKTATQLATAALLTNPPPNSLSLSPLLFSLASLPSSDTSLPMSLLTRLRHSPPSHHHHVGPIATTLASSYFRNAKPKLAFKIFNWIVRPGSTLVLDRRFCGVLVDGFCRNGMVLESLKVLRAFLMVFSNGGGGLGRLVCRGLLKEARVWEAVELSQALDCDDDGDVNKVLIVLDRIIENWTE